MSHSKATMQATPDPEEDVCVRAQENNDDDDKNEALPAVPTTPGSGRTALPAGRTVDPAVPTTPNSGKRKMGRSLNRLPKMTSMKTGAVVRGDGGDGYNEDENYTAFPSPLPDHVLRAAHYIDRDISEEFTKTILTFLQRNWDEGLKLCNQNWFRNLIRLETRGGPPDIVAIEAARAVNRGVIPNKIIMVANRAPHGRKWLSAEQKKTADEQEQKAASESGSKVTASPAECPASKKAKKNHDDDYDDYEE